MCEQCEGDVNKCTKCVLGRHKPNPTTGRCQRVSGQAASALPTGVQEVSPPANASELLPPSLRRQLLQVQTAIVGGQPAPRNRYPWMVSLRYDDKHNLYPPLCGGSLITPNIVMTAAHCLTNGDGTWATDRALPQVRVGGYEKDGGKYERRSAVWAMVHEEYDPSTMLHDVALILLNKPSTKAPVSLQPSGCCSGCGSESCPKPNLLVPAGTPVYAIGWGALRSGGPSPAVLHSVKLDVLPLKQCDKLYNTSRGTVGFAESNNTMICAGNPKKHADTCQGDSGGPLFIRGSVAAKDVQIGITSWGWGCAGPVPGVYSDVAMLRTWISRSVRALQVKARQLGVAPDAGSSTN